MFKKDTYRTEGQKALTRRTRVTCTMLIVHFFRQKWLCIFLKRRNINYLSLIDYSRMTTHSNCLFCLCCKWLVAAINDTFPLTVKIQMRIDCETIPDPHPRLETMVIASQGTQACGDELVVTGTSEGLSEGAQDSQPGSHEKVVTRVKRKAVEPVASAGLPLAERTEGVEEAGVGSEVVPNAQEVLNFIAHKCFKVIDQSKPEELNGFVRYLKKVRKVLVLDAHSGSLILTALCRSLEILDSLWYDYRTGHLNDMAQKYLVTKEVLKEFDLTELKLTTTIQGKEYMAVRKFFSAGFR